MNNVRRKKIYDLQTLLELLKTSFNQATLQTCINLLEDIKSDEEDAYDNMPESLQCSARGIASEESIERLEEALEYLNEISCINDPDEIEDNLDCAIDNLFNAAT